MNRSHVLIVLALVAVAPVAAIAQPVIESFNAEEEESSSVTLDSSSDGSDGSADDDATSSADEGADDSDGGALDLVPGSTLTGDERTAVQSVLGGQLGTIHKKCLSNKRQIMRPKLANVSGTAQWTLAKSGTATFAKGEAKVQEAAFFKTAKAYEEAEADAKKEVVAARSKSYNACAKGQKAKIAVKGKAAKIIVRYQIKYEGAFTKAVIDDVRFVTLDADG